MKSKRWFNNSEMMIALSALLIGLVTAFTSIYSAYVDREYARSAVWPRLEIFRSFNDNSFSYVVTNNGTGPALIKYAKVLHGSKNIKMWNEIDEFKHIIQSHISNRTLPPQKNITPVSYLGDNAKAFSNADISISIELCYCSIYEECWITDRDNRPTNIEVCLISDEQKFLQ